jgi:hypothetical protein
MSTINETAGPSRSADNFKVIFQAALNLNEYQTVTGKSLDAHPFATQLKSCDSPEAISNVLRTQAQSFSKFRKGDEKLMAWLDLTINILYTFSGMLGEGVGLESHISAHKKNRLRCPTVARGFKTEISRTLPHDRCLSEHPKRAMGHLRKRIEGLAERPPSKITLRLRVVGVAPYIDLVSAGAEQRRGEQLRDSA